MQSWWANRWNDDKEWFSEDYGYHWVFSEYKVADWSQTSTVPNQIMLNLAVGSSFAIRFPYSDKTGAFKDLSQGS